MAGFATIRGQEQAIHRLRTALRAGRVPHAYLFLGPQGVGKRETALLLAQALQCREAGDDACGLCEPCRKVASGRHPDVHLVELLEGKTRILIEQIRELQSGLAFRPFEGRHRVILLPVAELLTEEASNALLKTLEEPPDLTHFILTSHQPRNLLETIRSRCQQIWFAPLSRREVAQRLEAESQCSATEARILAGLAEGSVGRAAELLQRGILQGRAELFGILDSLGLSQPQQLFALTEQWGQDKEQVADRLDLLISWYRDLLVRSSGIALRASPGTAGSPLIHVDLLEEGAEPRSCPSRPEALRCLSLLLRAREAICERNANVRLSLERLFIGLISKGK